MNNLNPSRRGLIVMAVLAGLAALLACVCGLAALFLLRRIDGQPPSISLGRPTASPAAPAATRTWTPGAASTPAQAPTRTSGATAAATLTSMPAPSATPSPTHTGVPTSGPAPTSTPAAAASPTPFVCRDIADLSAMDLAPGQRFECTVQERTLTDLANSYEGSPCSQTVVRLDDGEIEVECRMGLTMSAALEARARDCRVDLRVLRGTMGFKGIVQELIATQFNALRYDDLCVEQVIVDDGEAFVAGRGR